MDEIAAWNKAQSDFYRKVDAQGHNDRADVTSGDGVSRFADAGTFYEEEDE